MVELPSLNKVCYEQLIAVFGRGIALNLVLCQCAVLFTLRNVRSTFLSPDDHRASQGIRSFFFFLLKGKCKTGHSF